MSSATINDGSIVWVATLEHGVTEALWQFRNEPLFVAYFEDRLLLAGESGLNTDLLKRLKTCFIADFMEHRAGQLFRVGERVPHATLMSCQWQPLAKYLQLEIPVAAYAVKIAEPSASDTQSRSLDISLRRRTSTIAASVQSIECDLFFDWFETQQLLNAASPGQLSGVSWLQNQWPSLEWQICESEVLIRGSKLLPLPGRRCYENGGFLLPIAYEFENSSLIQCYRRYFQVNEMTQLLAGEDGSYIQLFAKNWSKLTVQSVESTRQAFFRGQFSSDAE